MPELATMGVRWGAALGLVGALFGAAGCAARDAGADVAAAAAAAPLEALARLPAPPRRGAPRLSLVQGYRSCPADDVAPLGAGGRCAAAAARGGGAPPDLAVVVAAARARADARVDADALHALALADLAWSDAAGNALDRAISTLRTVARLSARPAPALADLAAALLVRADRRGEARDLLEAADVALLALESDSASGPARFNLALALGRIGLVDETARAWAAFLAVEPRGPWADEARRRAAAVAAAAVPVRFDPHAADLAAEVSRDPQAARLYGWEQALGRWGAALLAGDSVAARRALAWARTVGRALEARGGDATLADAVRLIDGAAPNAPRVHEALARAHRDYAAGAGAFGAGDFAGAERAFRRAAINAAPRTPDLPLHAWAAVGAAASVLQQGRSAAAERMSARLVLAADSARYSALAARARWVRASALQRVGRPEESLVALRAAAGLFARAGEAEHLGAVLLLTATAEREAGDRAAAHRGLHRALAWLRREQASVWRHNLLYVWAQTAAVEFPRMAGRVQDEGVTAAVRTGAVDVVAEARLARARLAVTAGDAGRADRELRAVRSVVERLPAGPDREWLRADQQLAEASMAMHRGAARHAMRVLDTAVTALRRSGNPARLVPALVARADARAAADNERGAQADLDEAAAAAWRLHDRTQSARLRIATLQDARRLIDRLVMGRLAAGRVREALGYMERARASFTSVGTRPAPADDGRAALPPGSVGLQVALIGDTLLVWTVAAGQVHLSRSTVSRAAMVGAIERVRVALELGAEPAKVGPDLAHLYDVMLRPVHARLAGAARLLVAADGEMAGVPLAALYDRAAGAYLVERHTLVFAPRLGGRRPPRRAGAARRVLLVADPAFDRSASPDLARLAGARAEVDAIAELYPAARTLSGAEADRARVISAFGAAEVAHYAGHAVFDDASPDRSHLLLARSADAGATRLTAADIDGLSLRHLRLLVLSACETGRPVPGSSGGFAGLTGAFLAAGVGGVVASRWRVRDDLTRPLMVDLHRHYRQHGDGADALRHAQLAALRSPDPARRSPAAWAGFAYAAP